MSRERIGYTAPHHEGAWSSAKNYTPLSVVTNNGSSYIAKKAVPAGTALNNSVYWGLLSSVGADPNITITKTGTSGLVDTYTWTDSTSGNTGTFTVTNGQDGDVTADVIATPYDNTAAYKVGNLLTYLGKQYYCIADAPAGTLPTNTTYFEEKSVADIIEMIKTGKITVGKAILADNLDSNVVQNDVNAYNFRTAGGSLEIGDTCKEKAIVGGSLGFNQLLPIRTTFSTNGITLTSLGNGKYHIEGTATADTYLTIYAPSTVDWIAGHKMLLIDSVRPNGVVCSVDYYNGQSFVTGTSSLQSGSMFTVTSSTYTRVFVYFFIHNGETVNLDMQPTLFDVTAFFGSTIADYLSNLNDRATRVAWFKRYFPKPYYPYTAVGGFTNVKTKGKKIVGFNQFNGILEIGTISSVNGQNADDSSRRRSAYIPVFPETNYYWFVQETSSDSVVEVICFYDANKNYLGTETHLEYKNRKVFATPANAYFMRFRTTANNSNYHFNLNFHYDGERDGEYEDYTSDTYECDHIELIGIPKIDEQGNLYFEGNRYNADGVVDNGWKADNLGTLSWHKLDAYDHIFYAQLTSASVHQTLDLFTPKAYKPVPCYTGSEGSAVVATDKSIKYDENGNVYINDSAYSTASDFATGMSGVYLIYPLKTATTDYATSYQEIQKVHNWGTEELLAPDNDTRPCVIPVGHDTDYPVDLKSKTEIMPDLPSDGGQYIVDVSSGTAEYIPLGSWLSTNDYQKLNSLSGYDANKTQTLKNVEGTLTWVDDQ